jgi:Pyruvate/2-oxoacid:ferredoxin oxidoreductase gamma subunit
MLHIGLHGRGGQGKEAASRIVGTTALWEGCCARDSADTRPTMPH